MLFYLRFLLALFLSFSLGSLLVACGESPKDDGQFHDPALQSASGILRDPSFNLSCWESDCPENVGIVVSKERPTDAFYSQCTGFLVEGSVVTTNSHCLSKSLKVDSARCGPRLAILFLSHGQKVVAQCRRVIRFSDYENTPQDYAQFEIEPVALQPIVVSQKGYAVNEALRVVKVTPIKVGNESIGGRLHFETCSVMARSLFNAGAWNRWAQQSMSNCGGVRGNSGSPMLNRDGRAVGILHAGILNGFTEKYWKKKGFDLEGPSAVPKNILLVNLACVPDPRTGAYEPKCDRAKDASLETCDSRMDFTKMPGIEEIEKRFRQKLSPHYRYEVEFNAPEGVLRATPFCVRDRSPAPMVGEVIEQPVALKLKVDPDWQLVDAKVTSRNSWEWRVSRVPVTSKRALDDCKADDVDRHLIRTSGTDVLSKAAYIARRQEQRLNCDLE